MENIVNEIYKSNEFGYWNTYYNEMKNKSNSELLSILGNEFEINTFWFGVKENKINNFDSLSKFEKLDVVNSLDNYKSIVILLYILKENIMKS